MATGSIKHLCSDCYGLDIHGRCLPHKGERRDNVDFPIECDDFGDASLMLWFSVASSMNPNFRKSELAALIIFAILIFFTMITFLMVYDVIPFFTVVFR